LSDIQFRSDVTVDLVQVMASDLQVARAAWVSTKGVDAREAEGRVDGLINYLVRERHGSPFEHNMFTFLIEGPMNMGEEHLRHRAGWSYNKWSGRYSAMRPIFYLPAPTRKVKQEGKPGSYRFVEHPEANAVAREAIAANSAFAWNLYEQQRNAGVANEVARNVLPSNIFTSYYATCNARSLMHFLGLRTEREDATFVSRPLWEIQLVADKMEALFAEQMPITYEAWNKNGRVAP
jgi:thymidylate synthase (FAD)